MTITPELKAAVEQAGDEPVRLEDPQTRQTYVLLKADDYERIREILGDDWRQAAIPRAMETPHRGWRKRTSPRESAARRKRSSGTSPSLLKNRRLRGKWVAYHRRRTRQDRPHSDRCHQGVQPEGPGDRSVRRVCDRAPEPGAGGG